MDVCPQLLSHLAGYREKYANALYARCHEKHILIYLLLALGGTNRMQRLGQLEEPDRAIVVASREHDALSIVEVSMAWRRSFRYDTGRGVDAGIGIEWVSLVLWP